MESVHDLRKSKLGSRAGAIRQFQGNESRLSQHWGWERTVGVQKRCGGKPKENFQFTICGRLTLWLHTSSETFQAIWKILETIENCYRNTSHYMPVMRLSRFSVMYLIFIAY